MPPRHPFDYAILNPDKSIRAWMEIKVRHMNHDQYPTQWIDFFKWCSLTHIADQSGLPVLLVYAFKDGIYMYVRKPGETAGIVELGGRRDRGDKYDIKPVINISIDSFDRLRDPIESIQ